ncbi:glycine betaine/proline transport system permease protein [Streptomonospora nanhaiensis]|uniref:Glycine betaine/proline transport system permease protein n=1 Tax=Streptomonospora nanhaiensis TaxID=1323731 RepID=A0A853BRW9_9ACTN|nr:ABC transporter permease subunit [Streptomonospora nanhaiensis]NYI97297.1 glycine betaine/proline transport system permease protein [Streptomonospora nanhaiensis]
MTAPTLTVSVPRVPVGDTFDAAINWLRANFEPVFDFVGMVIDVCVETLFHLFAMTSATQFTLVAAAVVGGALLVRRHRVPTLIAVAVWAGFYVAELAGGLVATVISSLPAPLFLWAMDLFGSEYVYPPLVLALLLLAALVAVSFAVSRDRRMWLTAVAATAVLLLVLVLHFVVGVQLSLLVAPLLVLLALFVAGWKVALFSALGFLLIISMEKWDNAMSSLALILVATVVAVVVSLPIGILAAQNDRVSAVVKPVLDFMQTLPAFVYLLPAIAFFSIGTVPGVIATVIFAMPPGVRLTELGIRQVDKELVEAGEAFGAPDSQILRRIQLPLALATIMAGVNQIIMLSLSMVVIAGMVGAGGLGNDVYTGIAQGNVPVGFEGGIAVVVLAIFLDRLTGAVTRFSPAARAQRAAA